MYYIHRYSVFRLWTYLFEGHHSTYRYQMHKTASTVNLYWRVLSIPVY